MHSASCLPQSLLYISVTQTADEWVKPRNHHCEEYRRHLVPLSRWIGRGHHLNEGNGPIAESDCSEVGGAGGEGLLVTLGGVHLQDGDEDVD